MPPVSQDQAGPGARTTVLSHIQCFILLDLLGDPTSTIYNLNPGTAWMFDRLVEAQEKLAGLQLLSPALQARMQRLGSGIFNAQLHPGGMGL